MFDTRETRHAGDAVAQEMPFSQYGMEVVSLEPLDLCSLDYASLNEFEDTTDDLEQLAVYLNTAIEQLGLTNTPTSPNFEPLSSFPLDQPRTKASHPHASAHPPSLSHPSSFNDVFSYNGGGARTRTPTPFSTSVTPNLCNMTFFSAPASPQQGSPVLSPLFDYPKQEQCHDDTPPLKSLTAHPRPIADEKDVSPRGSIQFSSTRRTSQKPTVKLERESSKPPSPKVVKKKKHEHGVHAHRTGNSTHTTGGGGAIKRTEISRSASLHSVSMDSKMSQAARDKARRRCKHELARTFVCTECSRRYEAWRSLQYHLRAVHSIKRRKSEYKTSGSSSGKE